MFTFDYCSVPDFAVFGQRLMERPELIWLQARPKKRLKESQSQAKLATGFELGCRTCDS